MILIHDVKQSHELVDVKELDELRVEKSIESHGLKEPNESHGVWQPDKGNFMSFLKQVGTIVHTETFSDPSFRIFAEQYLIDTNISVACKHNSLVAEKQGFSEVAKSWLLLDSLFGFKAEKSLVWDAKLPLDIMLQYYSSTCNVQMLATIMLILPHSTLDLQNNEWIRLYLELLRRKQLHIAATKIQKAILSRSTNIEDFAPVVTVLNTSCYKCQGVSGTSCQKCHMLVLCLYCKVPVAGLITWCRKCMHGSHAKCLDTWLKKEKLSCICGLE